MLRPLIVVKKFIGQSRAKGCCHGKGEEKKLFLGWKHKSLGAKKFVLQKAPTGGPRGVILEGPKDYPIKTLIKTAIDCYQNAEIYEIMKNCEANLRTSDDTIISEFKDQPCSVWKYLDDFPRDRFKLFLLTTKRAFKRHFKKFIET